MIHALRTCCAVIASQLQPTVGTNWQERDGQEQGLWGIWSHQTVLGLRAVFSGLQASGFEGFRVCRQQAPRQLPLLRPLDSCARCPLCCHSLTAAVNSGDRLAGARCAGTGAVGDWSQPASQSVLTHSVSGFGLQGSRLQGSKASCIKTDASAEAPWFPLRAFWAVTALAAADSGDIFTGDDYEAVAT